MESMLPKIYRTGVIAVLVIERAEDAVPLARSLLAGGIDSIELTLRTPAALEALRRIKAEVPEILCGIGTILTPEQAKEAAAAGAAFGVAPGMNPRVVQAARQIGLPFAPGVVTPSDIELALELGCRLLKFFPAEPSGGLKYLKSMAAPYAHLNVRFIPLGGLESSHIATYLKEPIIPALGGSWLAPRDVIRKQDWQTITANAREATNLVAQVRKGAA
jgi:2-dehydro-3-deoxyphosphogluconate aldolase/(4S)-4-hydroxy-2-oxoglutarate aldolase